MIKTLFIQKRILLVAGVVALGAFAFLFSANSAQAAAPIPTVTFLSVFESSDPAAGSGGTEICAGVSLTSPDTCSGTLEHTKTYRFEMTMSEGGGAAFKPTSHDFESAVGADDVLGTVVAGAEFSGVTCVGKTGTPSIVSSVTARGSGYTGGNVCTVAKSGTGVATWLITIDTDAVDGQATATFSATNGTNSDTSTLTTFNVAPPSINPPTVTTTDPATNITVSSATLGGNISATGGGNANERGFAWGTNSTLSGGDTSTTTNFGSFGAVPFNQGLSNLLSNKKYYFRAYAANTVGTSTGSIVNFLTLTDTTPSRKMRLFEGFTIKLISGRIILHQR